MVSPGWTTDGSRAGRQPDSTSSGLTTTTVYRTRVQPSEDERRRISSKQAFLTALNRLDRFAIRLGRLTYRGKEATGTPIFEQKRVDLQLGLDIASFVANGRVELVVLVAGDSDLIPAVKKAQEEGVLVRLVHGPKTTYHQDLWDEVDERQEITPSEVSQLLLGSPK